MRGHKIAVSTITTTDNTVFGGSTGTTTTVFKINGYTATKKIEPLVPVKSGRFPADGHVWRIFFFPDTGYPGIVSFQPRIICGNRKLPAGAIARFTLIHPGGGDGEPLSFTRTFRPYWGERMHYMAREELDKYVDADDDSVTVRCDVSVVETPSVVKVRSNKRKKVHGQCSSSSGSGSPPRLSSRIKTAWLGFTRRLLPDACTMLEDARPLLA